MIILTIIIPAYNVEKTLARCLDTLIDIRLIGKIEILIINDGSTDNTLDLANQYKKCYPDFVRIINKKNGGHGSTLNTGIMLAKGKYIRIIDGDDWVDTDSFIQSVNALEEIEADIVCMPYQRVDLNTYESTYFDTPGIMKNVPFTLQDVNPENLYFALAATCFATKLMRRANIHFLEHTFYVDVMLNVLPVLYAKDIILLPYDVYRYGVGNINQSISIQNFTARYKDHQRVIMESLEQCNINKFLLSVPEKRYIYNILKQVIITHCKILKFGLKDNAKLDLFLRDISTYDEQLVCGIRTRLFLIKLKHCLKKVCPQLTRTISKFYRSI